MQLLNCVLFISFLIAANCTLFNKTSQLQSSFVEKRKTFKQQVVDVASDCPQMTPIVPGHENGYCPETYSNETMKLECKDWDSKCDQCFKKAYLSQCIEICGSGQKCPDVLPAICNTTQNCDVCFDQVDQCLMCPEGLMTKIHSDHQKECVLEGCEDGQYHPNSNCTRCNKCKAGCKKCSDCGVCEAGQCETDGYCSQGSVCVPKGVAAQQICSNAGEYVSVNDQEWKKNRFESGNDGQCGEITCVTAENCGSGYFANVVTGWCELCNYPYGKECTGPSPNDNALPFCWKREDPDCKARGDSDCNQNYFFENQLGKKNCYESCESTPVPTFATGLEDTNVALCDPINEHCFCSPCADGIKKCSGRNHDDAIECNDSLKLTEQGTCVADCGPGNYAETCSQTGIEKCYQCHKSCLTCTNGAANACTSCKTPDFIDGGDNGEKGVCYPVEDVVQFKAWMDTTKPQVSLLRKKKPLQYRF